MLVPRPFVVADARRTLDSQPGEAAAPHAAHTGRCSAGACSGDASGTRRRRRRLGRASGASCLRGLANERTGYLDGVSDDHRCYAFGDPAPLSAEQQTRVCQERGYGNCPRYLRGVLVIPTEELEALRRPRAMPDAPPPPQTAAPEPVAKRRRRRLALVPLLLLLIAVAGGAAAGFAIFGGGLIGGVADATPTATPAATATAAPASIEPSPTPAPTSEAPSASELAGTPTPDPTPVPGQDTFDFFEVGVSAGDYTLYQVNSAGTLVADRGATFSRFSRAEVQRVEASNGLLHWRTIEGEYAGLSYIYPESGDFEVREVFRRPDGSRSSEVVPPEER
jgi:hypothetical protein